MLVPQSVKTSISSNTTVPDGVLDKFSFLSKVFNLKKNDSCADCFDANFKQQDSFARCSGQVIDC